MWNYLYFMHHLRRKPQSDYTGQESYVWHKVKQKEISFFPMNKSLRLIQLGATDSMLDPIGLETKEVVPGVSRVPRGRAGGWRPGGARPSPRKPQGTSGFQLRGGGGSANAETTPARAPAAAADRTQRPDATCEGKNG